MDYYSQGRPQVSAPQVNQHYMNYPQATAASYSMNYGQHVQPQQNNASYQQQHYSVPAGPASSAIDFGSPHGQTMNSHNQGNSGRARSVRSGIVGSGDGNHHQHSAHRYHLPTQNTLQDFPVRIVVDHKHVGAIIGNKGAQIKEIIMETKARIIVDVQKVVKDVHGNADKIITIVGPIENSGKAVVKILEIVQRELEKDENRESHEVELKIRAHNQLVGRLIGRLGLTIKKIMGDTGTNIIVSNCNEAQPRLADSSLTNLLPNFPEVLVQLERTITVKGSTIESVAAAEQKISAKLRQSFEMDLHNRVSFLNIYQYIVSCYQGNLDGTAENMAAAHGCGAMPFVTHMGDQWGMPMVRPAVNNTAQIVKTIKLYVPNNMVGAIIGAKGMNIRNIIRNSGALVRIEGGEKKDRLEEDQKPEGSGAASVDYHDTSNHIDVEEGQGDGPVTHPDEKKNDERLVTITGNDIQQFRAQYLIYQRIAEQQGCFLDEVKLRTEVTVPSRLVGRIIGKGGQNVKELQRITGATVKIPEDEPKTETVDETSKEGNPIEGTIVRIIGTIQGASSVQARIGQLIHEFNRTSIHDKRRDENNDTLSHNKPSSPSSSAAE